MRTSGPAQRTHAPTRALLGAASLLGLLLVEHGAGADEAGWRLTLTRDGVTVYQRPMNGSRIDEVRAVAVFELPAPAVLAVLADLEAYPRFWPPTVAVRRLKGSGSSRWYYVEIAPSVVARRFYCVHAVQAQEAGGVLRSGWTLDNALCPESQPGMVRIEDNAGGWTLTPLGDGRTEVVYQAHTDPGGNIPAWMVNSLTARALPETFAHLRKEVVRGRVARN